MTQDVADMSEHELDDDWGPPEDPDLCAEGWIWISKRAGDEEALWCHSPSRRTVSVCRWGNRGNITCSPNFGPYAVLCQRRDEDGCPYEGDVVGPFANLAAAFTYARKVRLTILERKRDVSMLEQVEMFAEGSG